MASTGSASTSDSFRSLSEEGCVSSPLFREELPWPTANAPGRTGARLSLSAIDVLVEVPPSGIRGTLDTVLRSLSKPRDDSPSFVSSWLVEYDKNPVPAAIDDPSALTKG